MYKREENILRIRMSLLTVSWALEPAVTIHVRAGQAGHLSSLKWKYMTLETRWLISTAGCIKSVMFTWVMFSEISGLKILQKTTCYSSSVLWFLLSSLVTSITSWPIPEDTRCPEMMTSHWEAKWGWKSMVKYPFDIFHLPTKQLRVTHGFTAFD